MVRERGSGRTWWLVGLLVGVLGVILLAGLSPRGFRFHNGVEWVEGGSGLAFDGKEGLAFSEPFLSADHFSGEGGLTIDIPLRVRALQTPGFTRILTVHAGEDSGQLLIGQWQDSVIVMLGDDYSYSRRLPRVSAPLELDERGNVRLTIASDARRGTVLYLNGKERGRNRALVLRVPEGEHPARLVLGSSPYGRNPWRGEVRRLAVFASSLTPEMIVPDGVGSGSTPRPVLLYPMGEGEGRRTANEISSEGVLEFPRDVSFVERRVLESGLGRDALGGVPLLDLVVNLLGFVPLGALLMVFVPRRMPAWLGLALVACCGSFLSLGIEWIQSFIPSRTSSLLDLALNSAGACLGALVVVIFRRVRGGLSSRPVR